LTVPHLPKDTVELRIGRAAAAWPEFLRRLNGWLRSIDAAKSSHWFRVLEWTPGESDDFGHPHFHLWFFGPFIPIDYLREWWRESLESLGVSFNGNHPIVHIERCHDLAGATQELIKYLTKDIDAKGNKISPEVYATVYRSFDGRRTMQASRGFMKLAKYGYRPCNACGVALAKRTEIIKHDISVHGPTVDSFGDATPSGGP